MNSKTFGLVGIAYPIKQGREEMTFISRPANLSDSCNITLVFGKMFS
jgi:hypothetical protein